MGSTKNDQIWTTGKVLKLSKFIFTIFHLVVVVIVVVVVALLLLQFRLAYLNNQIELRDDTNIWAWTC